MIFFFDKNGASIHVVPNRIFQNSNKANTIFFVYPVENQASIGAMFVNVAFTLPNGEDKPQRVMKPLVLKSDTGLNGVIDLDGNKFFIWEYDLKSDVTSYAGTVTCQFYVTVSGELITTASSTFLVVQGVPVIEPIETDSYQELLDYFTNVLAPSLGKTDLNLENGTGDYSIVQKTAEGEENEATASGTYAGGKKCKTTANRGFTHGNTVENNGNSAASFGQTYTNDGNVALTQMVGGYNGGASAVVVGHSLHNVKNQTANVPTDEGGAASALVGAYLYNHGSHSQVLGYLLKNRRALKTVLGIANEDKLTNVLEIGGGKEIFISNNNSFTYNNYTYTVNYDELGKSPISVTLPNGEIRTIGKDYRVEIPPYGEFCIVNANGTLKVYEAFNIFEIDKTGQIIAKGGLHITKSDSLAEMELQSDGLRVQGKGQFTGNVSGYKGTFSDGLFVKLTQYLAELELLPDGLRVQGTVKISSAPKNPTDAVRLTELNEVKQTIETLHKNGFVVVGELPTASSLTLGRIFLIAQANGSTNDVFDEYITIQTDTNAYTWEKIGSTQFTLIVDSELSTESENPVQNKVVKEALDGKLSLSGGVLTGEIAIGQGDGKGVQLGSNGRLNGTLLKSDGTVQTKTGTILGLDNGRSVFFGHTGISLLMRGNTTRPTYTSGTGNKELALLSDVDDAVSNAGGGGGTGGGKTYYKHNVTIVQGGYRYYLPPIINASSTSMGYYDVEAYFDYTHVVCQVAGGAFVSATATIQFILQTAFIYGYCSNGDVEKWDGLRTPVDGSTATVYDTVTEL